MSFECGQQRIMRLGGAPPGSPTGRLVLTNRMREYFTYGSVGGAGGNPGPYPAANAGRAPRFQSDASGPAWLRFTFGATHPPTFITTALGVA